MKTSLYHKLNPSIMIASIAMGCLLAATPSMAQDGSQVPFGSLQLSSGKEPVKIDADRLEMRDKDGIAIFTGNVSVVQGDTTLRSGQMTAHYNKDGQEQQAGTAGLASSGIDRLDVSGKVYLKSGTQVATGDTGTFDAKTQMLTLEGSKVVLTDGDNIATGCRMTANMNTGKAFLEACKGASKGRVSIIMSPNNDKK